MEGSTTESVGASTAEIPGVFGRGVVENESLAAFGEVKCAGYLFLLTFFFPKWQFEFDKNGASAPSAVRIIIGAPCSCEV